MKNFLNILYYRLINLIDHNSSYLVLLFIILIGYFINLEYYFLKLFISFVIFTFIFENFKYSETFLIRILQKAIIYIFCFYFALFALVILDAFCTLEATPLENEDSDDDTNENKNNKENKNKDASKDNINIYQSKEISSTTENNSSNTNDNTITRNKSNLEIIVNGTFNAISGGLNNSSKLLNDGNNLSDIVNIYLKTLFGYFKNVLAPIQVDYSNEILANQILDIGFLMFFIAILITGLIIVLLFNIFILINMDRILNFFTNKYIKWYLNFNKKMISIEVFILGISIIMFMQSLIKGLLFIATHPIIIS